MKRQAVDVYVLKDWKWEIQEDAVTNTLFRWSNGVSMMWALSRVILTHQEDKKFGAKYELKGVVQWIACTDKSIVCGQN